MSEWHHYGKSNQHGTVNCWFILEEVVSRRPTKAGAKEEMDNWDEKCESRVHNVEVETAAGIYKRPITKICAIHPAEGFNS